MKIELFDGKRLDLIHLNTFEERLSYIKDKVFDIPKYAEYYDITNVCHNLDIIKNIEKRWLGIKVVNKPHPNEHLKHALNCITGYLLGARDYSNNKKIKDYLRLAKMKTNTLSFEEKKYLLSLEKSVLYSKIFPVRVKGKDIVFIINEDMERLIQSNIESLMDKSRLNYTERYYLTDLYDRLGICKESKTQCLSVKNQIDSHLTEIERIKTFIKTEYKAIKDSNSKNVDTIIRLANQLKFLKDEVKHLEHRIKELYNDYRIATEFMYKH